ncbi:MAG TPA: hypothetical protein VGO93_12505 [Candidatus Xenobia bacterium]
MINSQALITGMRAMLSETDLKAIARSRGFAEAELGPGAFATWFLSSTGLSAAVATLSGDEVLALHLLATCPLPVSIEFFASLYGSEGSHWDTWPQRFRGTLKAVQQHLLRRGLLGCHQQSYGASQMERWRFWLPPEFHGDLPPLLTTRSFESAGHGGEDPFRRDFLDFCRGRASRLSLDGGRLLLEGVPYSQSQYRKRQQKDWESALFDKGAGAEAVGIVMKALHDLPAGAWVSGGALTHVLSGLARCQARSDAGKKGYEFGLLAHQEIDGQPFYRVHPDLERGTGLDFRGLRSAEGGLTVDAETVSPMTLDRLSKLASWSLQGGHLIAHPEVVPLGRLSVDDPLAAWLRDHAPAFAAMLADLDGRRGRTVVHSNLLVARVRDLTLRAALERTLGGNGLVHLAEEWVAFPRQSLDAVERLVKKAGFPTRTVGAK